VDQQLRFKDLCEAVGKGPTATQTDINTGLMVRPVKLGPRAVGFPRREIEAIMALRAGGGTDEQIRGLVRHLHAERERAAQRVLDSMRELEAA